MPEKNYIITLPGASGFTSAPDAQASPHSAIITHKVNQIAKKGVKGIHPTCCLPLWGREGVTVVFFFSQQKDEQNQVFSRAVIYSIDTLLKKYNEN